MAVNHVWRKFQKRTEESIVVKRIETDKDQQGVAFELGNSPKNFSVYLNETDFKNNKTTNVNMWVSSYPSSLIGAAYSWGGQTAAPNYYAGASQSSRLYYMTYSEYSSWYNSLVYTIRYGLEKQTSYSYSQGSYIGEVKSTNRSAYPDNNYSGNYWYVYKGIDNQAPTISGSDLDLGSKTENFEVEYIVSDVDNDVVTVDIIVDTLKKVDTQSVRLGIKNTYLVNLADFSLGRHTIKIIAKDSKGSTTTRTYTFTKTNTAPTISGNDDNLGGKSTAFTVNYRVEDANNDDVSVTISLDDTEIGNVTSAQNKELSVTVDSEKIQSLEIGTEHTITIKADDLKGGIAYRRYTFTKTNTAPIISGNDENLGSKTETFVQTFSITDIEKDKIYYQVFLDNVKVHEDLDVVDAKEYSYSIPHEEFIKLIYGTHKIKVVAWDDFNLDSKQERIYTFERVSNGLEVEVKINEFTVQPKKVIAVPHGIFADDCTKTVEVCNNYLDDVPKWENATAESKSARAYAFKNTTKTSEKWAIGVRIKITNGASGVGSVLRGMKGGYE